MHARGAGMPARRHDPAVGQQPIQQPGALDLDLSALPPAVQAQFNEHLTDLAMMCREYQLDATQVGQAVTGAAGAGGRSGPPSAAAAAEERQRRVRSLVADLIRASECVDLVAALPQELVDELFTATGMASLTHAYAESCRAPPGFDEESYSIAKDDSLPYITRIMAGPLQHIEQSSGRWLPAAGRTRKLKRRHNAEEQQPGGVDAAGPGVAAARPASRQVTPEMKEAIGTRELAHCLQGVWLPDQRHQMGAQCQISRALVATRSSDFVQTLMSRIGLALPKSTAMSRFDVHRAEVEPTQSIWPAEPEPEPEEPVMGAVEGVPPAMAGPGVCDDDAEDEQEQEQEAAGSMDLEQGGAAQEAAAEQAAERGQGPETMMTVYDDDAEDEQEQEAGAGPMDLAFEQGGAAQEAAAGQAAECGQGPVPGQDGEAAGNRSTEQSMCVLLDNANWQSWCNRASVGVARRTGEPEREPPLYSRDPIAGLFGRPWVELDVAKCQGLLNGRPFGKWDFGVSRLCWQIATGNVSEVLQLRRASGVWADQVGGGDELPVHFLRLTPLAQLKSMVRAIRRVGPQHALSAKTACSGNALWLACRLQACAAAEELCDPVHSVQVLAGPHGTTPLHWAAHWNQPTLVRKLERIGGDTEACQACQQRASGAVRGECHWLESQI